MIANERSSATESPFTQTVKGVNRQAAQHGHDKSTQGAVASTRKQRRTQKPEAAPVVTASADKVAWSAALLLAMETVLCQQPKLDERELRQSASQLLVFNPSTGTVTVYNSTQQAHDVRRRLASMRHLQP